MIILGFPTGVEIPNGGTYLSSVVLHTESFETQEFSGRGSALRIHDVPIKEDVVIHYFSFTKKPQLEDETIQSTIKYDGLKKLSEDGKRERDVANEDDGNGGGKGA